MKKISRGEFIKLSALGLAASAIPTNVWSAQKTKNDVDDKEFFNRVLKFNDVAVGQILNQKGERVRGLFGRTSVDFSILTASYCQPDSKYYKSKLVLNQLDGIITHYLDLQTSNGTIDSGGNRQSPPDTSFLLEHLCPSYKVLSENDFSESKELKGKLKRFMLNVGEGLITGGVHTPNHRWEVASGLTRLYSLFNDNRYLKRAEEWLAEGIYINEDGQYCERSRNYSVVVNNSLLEMGRVLNRPSFFEIIKKNLVATYYYMEANGDLVILDSRRQDQYQYAAKSITEYYMFYRFVAIHDNDEFLAAIAREIETFDRFDHNVLSQSLIFLMTNPLLGKMLPDGNKLPTDYSKVFALSGLARVRRDNITASFFGGNDKPITIASGRSCNPDFLTFRKGAAVLEYARLSTSFFNMGYFRSDGVKKEGNKYILYEKRDAYYFHPMPEDKRNKNGDYKLSQSVDRRFWSKMDFDSRPRTTLTQETKIVFEEENGSLKIDVDVTGPKDVTVTMDLCFRNGGKLEGVTPANEEDDFLLKDGYAKYIVGQDTITVGPGRAEHNYISRLDGEQYSSHFGTIKGKGMHVYLTGYVPFKYSFTIK